MSSSQLSPLKPAGHTHNVPVREQVPPLRQGLGLQMSFSQLVPLKPVLQVQL
jgi:hypothetical protein